MSGIRITQTFTAPFTVRLDWMFSAVAGDPQDHRLANAVVIALNSNRRALRDDVLPDPRSSYRGGWWGDTNAAEIWGGWPVGSRYWLLKRTKMVDAAAQQGSTLERARRYTAEALDPLKTARICSDYTTGLEQTGPDKIGGVITMFRGPQTAIALQFQDLWRDFGG